MAVLVYILTFKPASKQNGYADRDDSTHSATPLFDHFSHLIQEGFTNQEIADKLFISMNTVKTHLKNINIKLQANSRVEAVPKAKEVGIF